MKKYGRRFRKARKYVSARKAVRKARKNNFVKAVKKVIDRDTETKQAWFSSGNTLTQFNSGINSSGDMLQVIPNIAEGTGSAQRIGSKLKAKSMTIKGHMRYNTNDLADVNYPTCIYVRMMVVSAKYRQNYSDLTGSTAPLSQLLKKGGATSAWTGTFSDMNAPINTELWTVHAQRKFYLNQSAFPTVGAAAPSATVANDVKNLIKFFNIPIRCKNKILRYDPGLGANIQPTNYSPIILLGYCYLDGTSPDTISTPLGMEYIVDFRYEDL